MMGAATRAGIAIALLMLAGCTRDRPRAPSARGVECNANPAQMFVGRRYQPALGSPIRHRAGARTMRVIRPGEAVTMDFRPDRVNVAVDDLGMVSTIRCG